LSAAVTVDTNIAVYALSEGAKAQAALVALRSATFVSVQLLSELANVGRRKLGLGWPDVALLVEKVREAVATVIPVTNELVGEAIRIAERYRLSYYDSLMLAAALSGGAQTFFSEDLQHDLIIDGTLRIVDPFR
jgi:predicted nucleic acid-binding protein